MIGYLLAGALGYLVGTSYKASLRRRSNPIGGRMTKAQAVADFKENILPSVVARYGRDDHVAISEAWNDYTDMLHKDRLISDAQYSGWTNPY